MGEDFIRKQREREIEDLQQQLAAVTEQLTFADGPVARKPLENRRAWIENKLREARQAIAADSPLRSNPAAEQAAATGKGTASRIDPQTPFKPGRMFAFMVGVNHYDDASYGVLPLCVADVEAIGAKLLSAGYEQDNIRLLTDDTKDLPTRGNILAAFRAWAGLTTRDDLLLFYYSGHGEADEHDTYLVGRDGHSNSLAYTAVKLSEILAIMREAQAAKNVIILDACHSGADIPRKSAMKMSAQFIRNVFVQAEGTVLVGSCREDESSYLWDEKNHSAFTHFLLRALDQRADLNDGQFVTVQDVNRLVTDGLRRWAAREKLSQTPTFWGELTGDFILADYRGK